jgi:hypothetical protein
MQLINLHSSDFFSPDFLRKSSFLLGQVSNLTAMLIENALVVQNLVAAIQKVVMSNQI